MRLTTDQRALLARMHRLNGESLVMYETTLTEKVAITRSVAHGLVEVETFSTVGWTARLTEAGLPVAQRCAAKRRAA